MNFNRGNAPRQAHVNIPDGTVEEEFGRDGFFGRVSHLYRTRPPVEWIDIEGECRPESFFATQMPGLAEGGDYLKARVAMLYNDDVTLYMAHVTEASDYYYRNADGDDVLFIHAGGGKLETDFGPLTYRRGDYLVLPRGTMYRLIPSTATEILVISTTSEVALPDRGLLGKHALFDPDVMEVPTPETPERPDDPWKLKIKRLGKMTTVTYPFNPINVVAWKGDLCPWQLNIDDIRPITSPRYHLPPPVHATFVAKGVYILSFFPRPLETGDPNALRVPFFHSNIDFDEFLFYHDGDFFSRKGIDSGMATFHPQGIHHGPQPGAKETAAEKTHTDEKAIMVDTVRPLIMTDAARAVRNADYWKSWMVKPG